jgi:phage gp46-like protein
MTIGVDAVLTDDFDMQIGPDGDILTDDFFDTALLMSLFCERRATADEMPQSELRRGWIGNEETPDFEIGSKLWLYEQARATLTTFRGIETVVLNGLQWFIDDGLIVNNLAKVSLNNGAITLETISERFGSTVDKRFFKLWDNTGLR